MLPPIDNRGYVDLDEATVQWYEELSTDTQMTIDNYLYEVVGYDRSGEAIYEYQFAKFADHTFPYWRGDLENKVWDHTFTWIGLALTYFIIDFAVVFYVIYIGLATGLIDPIVFSSYVTITWY